PLPTRHLPYERNQTFASARGAKLHWTRTSRCLRKSDIMYLAISVRTVLWLCVLLAPAFAADAPASIEPSAVWPSLRTLRSEILDNYYFILADIFAGTF